MANYCLCTNMFIRALIILLPLLVASLALPLEDETCLDGCPEFSKNKINVHLIPHSHDDVGWLKTFDQYYYGGRTAGVDAILSSVVAALKRNPARRYIQVETAFFWKWWQQQSKSVQEDFKNLVQKGQIEMVNGGWVMNDEACTNYMSTIHQFTTGLRILEDTLGMCGRPKVGWQIDPFGHSSQQAVIYQQLGFRGVFMSRVNYLEKTNLTANKNLEFIWKTSDNSSGIFYGIMMNHYGAPLGFCFDVLCEDDAIVDDPDSFDYNADYKKRDFESVLDKYAAASMTGNILIPMGGDFNFQSAERNYMNMDKLVAVFENHPKYNVFYSTPSCYIKAVNEKKAMLPVKKSGDFFPYADSAYAYWTGFYTSRPNSKRFERTSHNILQASKQLRAIFKMLRPTLTGLDKDAKLTTLQEAIATMQHHDAITGTEKQAVDMDYRRSILKGIEESEAAIGTIIGTLLSKSGETFQDLKLTSCLLTNISQCDNSGKDRFVVTVYNPLSVWATHYVRLPVSRTKFDVTGLNGPVQYDIVPAMFSDSKHEIVFAAKDVPPMGLNFYYVAYNASIDEDLDMSDEYEDETYFVPNTYGSKTVNFTLNNDTNQLESVAMNGIKLNLTQHFYYYPSEDGTGSGNAPSGAYVFRPKEGTSSAVKVHGEKPTLIYNFTGKVVDEVAIHINDRIKQIIRVYKDDGNNFVEFDWSVGPIECDQDREGKEYVTRFEIQNFNNNGTFYTDSNGKEMVERQRNRWVNEAAKELNVEPIASNFYPVTSKITVRDLEKKVEVAVLNDRSQGGSSMKDGEIELMVHRRLFFDDSKGVNEALNEEEFGKGMVVRGRHQLMVGATSDINLSEKQKELEMKNLLAPYVLVADATAEQLKLVDLQNKLNFQLESLANALPNNVHIITFERWNDNDGTYLLRLENTIELSRDAQPEYFRQVDLDGLFQGFKIKTKEEKTLGGVQGIKETKHLEWTTTDGELRKAEDQVEADTKNIIYLRPGAIKTFVITLVKG